MTDQWTPQQWAPPQPMERRVTSPQNGLAVAGFICGVIGAAFGMIPLLGMLGVVFGIIGIRRAGHGYGHRALAWWALILGAAALALGAIGVVIVQHAVDRLRPVDEETPPTEAGGVLAHACRVHIISGRPTLL